VNSSDDEQAMAARPAPAGGINAVLDQLGTPEEIVRAAGPTPDDAALHPSASPLGTLEIVAIIALLVGGLVIPVLGWLVGVVLLWLSPRWKTGDKLLATLVWPGGLLAPVVVFAVLGATALFAVGSVCSTDGATTQCTPPPIPPWLAITLSIVVMIAAVAGPILVAIRLIRRARRAVAPPEGADPDLLTTPLPA
jgi:hypothetical protein